MGSAIWSSQSEWELLKVGLPMSLSLGCLRWTPLLRQHVG